MDQERLEQLQQALNIIGKQARKASQVLMHLDSATKNRALMAIATKIEEEEAIILSENQKDIERAKAKGLEPSLLDRLLLNSDRIKAMARGVREIIALPDPVGKILNTTARPNGLRIDKVSVPLGVIAIIYESRPNVTIDAAALCLKSGNVAILRGGSESELSSKAIVNAIHHGIESEGLTKDMVQYVPVPDREMVGLMLKLTDYIDIIVPRGGKGLCARVMKESRIPTILHLEGNCHTYIHKEADPSLAKAIVHNAKLRRTGICGATESILVDRAILTSTFIPVLNDLIDSGCEVRGDKEIQRLNVAVIPANETDWDAEYLDKIVSIRTVNDVSEAIDFINLHGSHHTDAIITKDSSVASAFLSKVDSAIVMHNTSTQFADGGEFGMGAEIGISTGRLHARGPVGVEQLTTYKYVVHGEGQLRP